MMKVSFVTVLCAAALWLCGGCVLMSNDYVESSDYDLTLPAPEKNTPCIRIGVFKNLSGSDRRFLCRGQDGRMIPLEYQRWLLSPELMLQRCMYGAFCVDPTADDGKLPQVSCILFRFEFDEKERTARLSADFEIRRANGSRTLRVDFSSPVKGDIAGGAGAMAMSECAKQAISALAGALK